MAWSGCQAAAHLQYSHLSAASKDDIESDIFTLLCSVGHMIQVVDSMEVIGSVLRSQRIWHPYCDPYCDLYCDLYCGSWLCTVIGGLALPGGTTDHERYYVCTINLYLQGHKNPTETTLHCDLSVVYSWSSSCRSLTDFCCTHDHPIRPSRLTVWSPLWMEFIFYVLPLNESSLLNLILKVHTFVILWDSKRLWMIYWGKFWTFPGYYGHDLLYYAYCLYQCQTRRPDYGVLLLACGLNYICAFNPWRKSDFLQKLEYLFPTYSYMHSHLVGAPKAPLYCFQF